MRFAEEVREYISYCARYPQVDRRYHPTADGAVKMIWHRGKDEARAIKTAFGMLTGHRETEKEV